MRSQGRGSITRRPFYAAIYVGVGLGLVYGLWNPAVEVGDALAVAIFAAVILGQPVTGYAIGSYWALALPYAVTLFSVPAGYDASAAEEWEPLPIWWSVGVAATACALLMVPAIVLRRVREGQDD
ncbi:MAG TPA: hypothetical protein VD769_02070 [Gaiellaceae bacterium]|nr:hypothetical protein [Gaiellaceae bacterium]